MPREHGAYAQLAFPLLTAFLLGAVGMASALLATATLLLFLAHEPVVVLLGGRGARAREDVGSRAVRRAALLLIPALAVGTVGLIWASPAARLGALAPMAFATAVAPLVVVRREKTFGGELLVAFAFSSALVPVALAGGVPVEPAVVAAAVWAVIFLVATLTVHTLVRMGKRGVDPRGPALRSGLLIGAVLALAGVSALRDRIPGAAALALLPPGLVALAFVALRVHPRHLKVLGWSLVAANVVTLVALVVGLR